MTDLEHDLTSAANRLSVGHGDVDMVMARGRNRRNRRTRVLGGVTAIAVVASLAAITNMDSDKTTPLASMPNVSRGDGGLDWEALSTSDGIGFASRGVAGQGPFYALSTAPGRADVNKTNTSRVLYRSNDGVEWTPTTTFGNDLYVSDLAPASGRVYAVGTSPAQAGSKHRSNLAAAWSDDGGKSFSKTELPVDWASMEARSTSVNLGETQVASNGAGTVVTATVRAALDVPRILPDGVTAPDGWATTATGVDVLGPDKGDECPAGSSTKMELAKEADAKVGAMRVSGANDREQELPRQREVDPNYCFKDGGRETVIVSPQDARGVVRSLTWDELGVTGDLKSAVTDQVLAYFAPANSTDFTRIDLGDAPADMSFLDADENGFHLFLTSQGPNSAAAATKDLSSTDGKSWTSNNGPSGLQWVTSAGTLNGVRIVVGEGAEGAVVARGIGGDWDTASAASLIDPSVVKARPVHIVGGGVGPLGVVLAVMPELGKDDTSTSKTILAYSRDGSHFGDKDVEELAGKSVGQVLQVFVSGQRAVVALSGGFPGEGKDPLPQTILVGTAS